MQRIRLQRSLMLGNGSRDVYRKFDTPTSRETEWVTVDINASANPDVVFDLNDMEKGWPLPFKDEEFDEIHAYSVMILYGTQGDYHGWFAGWRELWRILKPNGYVVGGVPWSEGAWVFGDPGTRRVIMPTTLLTLTKKFYDEQKGATDYRRLVEPWWWKIVHSQIIKDKEAYYFGLQKCLS